jgi:hypothetical protein
VFAVGGHEVDLSLKKWSGAGDDITGMWLNSASICGRSA